MSELLTSVSSRELAEWEAHFALRAEEQQGFRMERSAVMKLEARTRRKGR